MNDALAGTEQAALRRRLARLARLMDSSIRIPVIGKRIGWDAILGLVPVVGDAAGALISAYIVLGAVRIGVPSRGIVRMLGNIGVETLIGAVPVFGDLFDMAFRANLRNVALIERYTGNPGPGAEPSAAAQDREDAPRLLLFLLGLGSVVAAGVVASRLLASPL